MASFNQALFQRPRKNKLKPCLTITVNKKSENAGRFVSVQTAIKSLPVVNYCRLVISIGAGAYWKKVEIPASMAYITLEGAVADKTFIARHDTADRVNQPGTYASATFAINSPSLRRT